ncbi:polymorphic toxin-type HINT domain-containing protein [Cystobacter fuscus]
MEKGFDADLGLIRMGVRDYDPGLNRFMTPDPLFLEQPKLCVDRPVECNLYGYAVGNPVTFVDPKGTVAETVWDVASLGMGIYSIRSWKENNTSTFGKVMDVIGVVADAAAVVVPFVPGGAGAAIKGARAVDNAIDAVQGVDKANDAVRAAERASEAANVVNKADGATDAAQATSRGCVGGSCGLPEGCFVAGTPVLTSEGLRAIEEIQAGAWVWARSDKTQQSGWRRVVRTTVKPEQPILTVRLANEDGHDEEIGASGNHPFWVEGQGWRQAKDLRVGDRVPSADGGWLRVTHSVWAGVRQPVYNFEVEELHTYFVGGVGAWVHNNTTTCLGNGKGYIPDTDLPQQSIGQVDIPTPDPRAQGAHTTLGGRTGSDGVRYRQSATFSDTPSWPKAGGKDVPNSRVDWHDHGRPNDHTNPHQHVFTHDRAQGKWVDGPQQPFFLP